MAPRRLVGTRNPAGSARACLRAGHVALSFVRPLCPWEQMQEFVPLQSAPQAEKEAARARPRPGEGSGNPDPPVSPAPGGQASTGPGGRGGARCGECGVGGGGRGRRVTQRSGRDGSVGTGRAGAGPPLEGSRPRPPEHCRRRRRLAQSPVSTRVAPRGSGGRGSQGWQRAPLPAGTPLQSPAPRPPPRSGSGAPARGWGSQGPGVPGAETGPREARSAQSQRWDAGEGGWVHGPLRTPSRTLTNFSVPPSGALHHRLLPCSR